MRKIIPLLTITLATPLMLAAADNPAHRPLPKFASAVESERYPSASFKEQAQLRWDFSQKRDYRYRFEQTSDNSSTFGEPGESNTSVNGSGDLVVRTAGDGTAKLIFDNVKTTMKMNVEGQDHSMTQDMPTFVVAGMNEDGSSTNTAAEQAFVKLLFPLPPKSIPVGGSVEVPMEIPFSAMGSVVPARGSNRIKNVGYVMLGKRLCAQLEAETEVSRLDMPEEVAGKYEFALTARSVFFFDVATRSFVRGVLAVTTRLNVDTPTPKFDGDNKTVPERMKVGMTSDDLIKVTAQD